MSRRPSPRSKRGGRALRLGASLLLLATVSAAKPRAEPRPLSSRSFQEILAGYTFIADFAQKEPERTVSEEPFWRYTYALPDVEFPILFDLADPATDMPRTAGSGRALAHMNRGRALFLEKKYDDARATWLAGRARYGTDYRHHRRNDYFISQAFLRLAEEQLQAGKTWSDEEVKGPLSNAATFLSWALIVRADHPDELVDRVMPRGLYNLAAIYWRYGRYAGAYGAAESGLNFLRKTGRAEHRSDFHRFVAEAHIRGRTYLEAIQTLDRAIRQDATRPQAAAAFARAGDIYFDLNNYELAEEAYAFGARIDEDTIGKDGRRLVNPAQLVLRGEALFWLGRFSDAQKALHHALEGAAWRNAKTPLPDEFVPWASLRVADAYLAQGSLEKAKLEYFRVGHSFPHTLAGRVAKVREACLNLPEYQGNNVMHARALLEEAKANDPDMPPKAVELAWSCQVASYTQRERTPEMLARVKAFAEAYPEARVLASFVEPVRSFQAAKIAAHFDQKDHYRALSFFEKNRATLFPKVDDELAAKLFVAYADVFQPDKAAEFWEQHQRELPATDLRLLREAIVAAELHDRKAAKVWTDRNAKTARDLATREWSIGPTPEAVGYVRRFLNVGSLEMHLPWLARLARRWAAKNTDYACDLEVPLLSRTFERSTDGGADVLQRLTAMIDAKLPELFKVDESCALSMLELEQKILRRPVAKDDFGQPTGPSGGKELAARYMKRKDWELVGGYLHLYWTIAEHLHDDGHTAGATSMWSVLKDKGPRDAPETQFARARLDTSKTELEKLWD